MQRPITSRAFWEGPAAAWDRLDQWSDIDAYLLVGNGKVGDTFEVVDRILRKLSPIRQKYVVKNNWPGVSQAFYRLDNASEYLVLDLRLLTESPPEKFLAPKIHGDSIFYFNKTKIDQRPDVDIQAFEKKAQ